MIRSTFSSIVTLGVLLAALVVGVFVWQPVRSDLKILRAGLTAEEAQLSTLQGEVNALLEAEARLPVAETERARLLKAVPVGLNQDQLVLDLSAMADEVGISLNSMTFSPQDNAGMEADTVSVVANFTGNYEDLVALLQAFETADRLFTLNSISVQLGEASVDNKPQMSFSVIFDAYYQ